MALGEGMAKAIGKWLQNVSHPDNWYDFANPDPVKVTSALASPAVYKEVDQSRGIITFTNGDRFEGSFPSPDTRTGCLKGLDCETEATWINDHLDGLVCITDLNGKEIGHYKQGVRHGLVRQFGPCASRQDNLKMIAFFNSGQASGVAWKGLIGGAYLVGPLDDNGYICGDQAMYIYPDLHTAIVGEFAKDRLVSGYSATIRDISFQDHILLPRVETKHCCHEIVRDVATNKTISNSPKVADDFEASRVVVKTSLIKSDIAGEGLFAKRSFQPGELVALFNGVRTQTVRERDMDETSQYKIRLNSQIDLDIPDDSIHLKDYCATLAHKSNHSFKPNVKWTRLEHPRFGLICSMTAIKDIQAGDEIMVNYGYSLAVAPLWYKILWVEHCRHDLGMDDSAILNWCGRKYAMNGAVIDLPLSTPTSREKA